jgi:hypothetical protein
MADDSNQSSDDEDSPLVEEAYALVEDFGAANSSMRECSIHPTRTS